MRLANGIFLGGGGARRAPTFSDITGLTYHFSTSYGTSDATKWTPRVGASDATQPGAANARPVLTAGAIGGKPGYLINQTGAIKHWLLPALSSLTAAHIFMVTNNAADPGSGGAWWHLGSSGSTSHTPFTDSIIYDDAGGTVRRTVGNPAATLAGPNIYEVITRSGEHTFNLNGTQLFTNAVNTVGWDAVPTIGTTGNSFDGYVGDFVIFNAKLSTNDAATVRARLKAWFGTP